MGKMKFFEFLKMSSPKSNKKEKKKMDEATEAASEVKAPSEAVEATEVAPEVKEASEAVTQEESTDTPNTKPEMTQTEIIAEVLDKMGLGSEDMSMQEKLDALCLIFKHTITENAQLKDT